MSGQEKQLQPSPDTATGAADRQRVVRNAKFVTLLVLVVLALGAGRTVYSRMSNAKTLEATATQNATLYVKITSPSAERAIQTVMLPGTLQGFVQSPIAARASGYLKRWHKDIGSRVEKGDLLAEIDTPEIDQQLSQAVAARTQAAASLGLAQSTAVRWEELRKKDAVSQQELDERRSAASQAQANLAAADANVERLRQLEGFKRVVAPFSGLITRRNVDVGDLIDAGGGAARAMFILQQTDPLRVYVNVPQAYAHLVKQGQDVDITQTEMPGKAFRGKVVRTSGAIDTATRTMQIEVQLPNKDGVLLPGAYVQVALPLPSNQNIVISTNTLLFRADGIHVALVDSEGKVKLQPVKLGRNFGERVEILDGITRDVKLVLNPPDWLNTGDRVKIAVDGKTKG